MSKAVEKYICMVVANRIFDVQVQTIKNLMKNADLTLIQALDVIEIKGDLRERITAQIMEGDDE